MGASKNLSFQELVRKEKESQGGTLAEAMGAVVRKHPEAHAAFLKSGESLIGPADTDKGFLELVADCQALCDCSKAEAMRRVCRSHPNAHRKFIEQANSTEG